MTSLFYMSMKFIIRNKFLIAESIIESNRNLFDEYDIHCVLIIIQIIVIVFFYVFFDFDENDVVNSFLKRFVV